MTKQQYIDGCICALYRSDGAELREIAESLWEAGERAGRRAGLLEAAEIVESRARGRHSVRMIAVRLRELAAS